MFRPLARVARTRRASRLSPARPGFRPTLEGLEDRVVPAPSSVSNTNNAGDGSLRAAIQAAYMAGAGGASQTIIFAHGVTGTIHLQTPLADVNGNITLIGPGSGSLTIAPDPN